MPKRRGRRLALAISALGLRVLVALGIASRDPIREERCLQKIVQAGEVKREDAEALGKIGGG
jgi:hypothetical protein